MKQSIKLIQSPIPQALILVGNDKRYQLIIIALMAAIYFQISTIILGLSYLMMPPLFKCSFSMQLLNEKQACSRISQCYITNSYTMISQMGLYCDREIERQLIQSLFPIGALFGLILMNFVCDIKGRRFSVLASLLCTIVGILLTILGVKINSVTLVLISQILCGFGAYALCIIPYTIFYDICSQKMQKQSIIFMNVIWAIAEMFFYIYNELELKWDKFQIYIILLPSSILLILTYKILLQSPNFVLDHEKKPNDCLEVLKKIANYNRVQNSAQIKLQGLVKNYYILKKQLSNSRGYKSIQPLNVKRILQKLFRNWQHMKPIVILSIVYASTYIFYFGIQYSFNSIGFNFSINMLLMGCMQLLAYIFMQYFSSTISKIKRKKGFLVLNLSAGIMGFLFIFKAIQKNKIAASILVCNTRLLTCCGYVFFAYLQTQSFRPKVRSTGAGMIQGLSQIGTFVCPYILSFLISKEIYPVYVLSLIMIIFILPILLIEQTLQDTNTIPIQNQVQSDKILGSYQKIN